MKILFIKPRKGNGPQTIDVPLAFLYLSSFLKQYLKESVDIELVDLRLTRNTGQTLTRRFNDFQPDLIGISLLAMDKNFLSEWSSIIQEKAPKAKIVIGGPAVTYGYEELLLTNKAVSLAVVGEGEVTFLNLVRALTAGEEIGHLDGIAYDDGKKVVCNPRGEYIANLDTLPFPDYSLVDLSTYFGFQGNSFNGFLSEKRYAPVISSRGCPFLCIYCHNIFGKKIHWRSPENFVREIQCLHDDCGIREFHIIDDVFNLDKKRMHTILNLIVNSDMNIKLAFPNGLRADLLGKDDIALLKKAGAYSLTFAIESASPRIQKIIKKNLNIEKVIENIEYAESIGLIVRGFFMLGFPGETIAEMQSTVSLARKSSLDLASFLIVIPFKGTALSELVATMYPNLTYFVRGDYWEECSFYYLATGYNIRRAQMNATLKFYFPFRAFKMFRKVPHKLQLVKFFRDFFLMFYKIRKP